MRTINVILSLLISFALVFGVLEVGLRLIGFAPPPINTEFDPDLGWRGQAKSRIDNRSSEYDVSIRLDAFGLRDDFNEAGAREKPAGLFRVLFLGDSFVGGYTVDRQHLFVDMIEKAYAREGRRVQIVNAGVQGYSTDQQLAWLQRIGAGFLPDLVVAFPFENDIWWNGQPDYRGAPKPSFDERGVPSGEALDAPASRSWFERTAIGNFPRHFERPSTIELGGQPFPVEWTSRLQTPPLETLRAETITSALIGEMARASRAMGASFAVCPIPTREHVQASLEQDTANKHEGGTADMALDARRPLRIFENAAEAHGAPVLRVARALEDAAKSGEEPYYEDDFHLNPKGNAIMAAGLYDALDRTALIRAADPGIGSAKPDPSGVSASHRPWPRWPLWYLGLVLGLGTLYSRTYPDESKARAYGQVALLLGTVFAAALMCGALVRGIQASTGPAIGWALAAATVIGACTLIARSLGDRIGTIFELMKAFTLRGHWYLLPLLSVLVTVGSLLVLAASSPLAAPFIYTLF